MSEPDRPSEQARRTLAIGMTIWIGCILAAFIDRCDVPVTPHERPRPGRTPGRGPNTHPDARARQAGERVLL
jgi:hypothetical protein